jgi:hypothetical protein
MRLSNKITNLQEENDEVQGEINSLKLKRLQGDDSLASENMI